MVLSVSVTANPTGENVQIRRGLVVGDIAARSAAGDTPSVQDALAILRGLVGLSGYVRDDPRPAGVFVGGNSGSSSGGSTICSSAHCNNNATVCQGCANANSGTGSTQPTGTTPPVNPNCDACPGLNSEIGRLNGDLATANSAVTDAQNEQQRIQQLLNDANGRIEILEGQLEAPCVSCDGTRVCAQCTTLSQQLKDAQYDRDSALQSLQSANTQREEAIKRADDLQDQINRHVCEPTPSDPLGNPSGALPGSAPRGSQERARINSASDNVWHITLSEGLGGRPPAATGVSESGHFVRFNEPIADSPNNQPNTLHIRRGGTYVLTGTLNGSVYVNAHDRPWSDANPTLPNHREPVVIILNNVTINNPNGAAIHGRRSSNIEIRIQDGTNNTLSDAATYTPTFNPTDPEAPPEPSAVIFSQHDLIVTGRGNLTINGRLSENRWRRTGGPQGTAQQQSLIRGRGIESRDMIEIRGGNITINTLDTAVHGRDGVTINNGRLTLRSQFNNGIRASNATSGGQSVPTLGNITIRGGLFDIQVRDDALSAERTLNITGGTFNATNPNAGAGDD
jgi:TolA-binding protein